MTRKEMTARRYAELFSIADAALDLFKKMDIDSDYSLLSQIKFQPDHLLAIAATNAINGLEAFVNHIGFIFDSEWSAKYQRKNFWDQYARVISILKLLKTKEQIVINDQPFDDFENYRESIRNPFGHVHSQNHDIKILRKEIIDCAEVDFKESHEMIHSWIQVTYEVAFDVLQKSLQFVTNIHTEFKKNFFQSFKLAQILHRSGYFDQLSLDEVLRNPNIIPFYDERQSLLGRFMRDALNHVPVVSGNYIPV